MITPHPHSNDNTQDALVDLSHNNSSLISDETTLTTIIIVRETN